MTWSSVMSAFAMALNALSVGAKTVYGPSPTSSTFLTAEARFTSLTSSLISGTDSMISRSDGFGCRTLSIYQTAPLDASIVPSYDFVFISAQGFTEVDAE